MRRPPRLERHAPPLLFVLLLCLLLPLTHAQDLAISSPNASSVWATAGLQIVTYTGIPPGTDVRANATLSLVRIGSAYTPAAPYVLRASDWDMYDGAVVVDTTRIGIGASPLTSGSGGLQPAQAAGLRPGGGYQVLLELGGQRALSAPFLISAASGSSFTLAVELPRIGARWDVTGPITVGVVVSHPANITVAPALGIAGGEHWFHPLPGAPGNARSLLDTTGSWNRTRTISWNITADWLRAYTDANGQGGTVRQQSTHVVLYNARRGLEGDKWADSAGEMNASLVARTAGNATRLGQSDEFAILNAASSLTVSGAAVMAAAAVTIMAVTTLT